jgi:hypothetical protein
MMVRSCGQLATFMWPVGYGYLSSLLSYFLIMNRRETIQTNHEPTIGNWPAALIGKGGIYILIPTADGPQLVKREIQRSVALAADPT